MSTFAIVIRTVQFIRVMALAVVMIVYSLQDLLRDGKQTMAWDLGWLLGGIALMALAVWLGLRRARREIARRKIENTPVAEAPDAGTFWRREGYVRDPRAGGGGATS